MPKTETGCLDTATFTHAKGTYSPTMHTYARPCTPMPHHTQSRSTQRKPMPWHVPNKPMESVSGSLSLPQDTVLFHLFHAFFLGHCYFSCLITFKNSACTEGSFYTVCWSPCPFSPALPLPPHVPPRYPGSAAITCPPKALSDREPQACDAHVQLCMHVQGRPCNTAASHRAQHGVLPQLPKHLSSRYQCDAGTWQTNRPAGRSTESSKGTNLHKTVSADTHRAERQLTGQRMGYGTGTIRAGTLGGNTTGHHLPQTLLHIMQKHSGHAQKLNSSTQDKCLPGNQETSR